MLLSLCVSVCVVKEPFVGWTRETSTDRCEATTVLLCTERTGPFIKTEEAAKDTVMCSLSDLCMSLRC